MSGRDRDSAGQPKMNFEELAAEHVKQDWCKYRGKVVALRAVSAYDVKDDSVNIRLDPPVLFRVSNDIQPDMLTRTTDKWVDPIYDVAPLNSKEPQLAGLRSFWCYVRSYRTDSDVAEDGDIVGDPVHETEFDVDYCYELYGTMVVSAPNKEMAEEAVRQATLDQLNGGAENAETRIIRTEARQ